MANELFYCRFVGNQLPAKQFSTQMAAISYAETDDKVESVERFIGDESKGEVWSR